MPSSRGGQTGFREPALSEGVSFFYPGGSGRSPVHGLIATQYRIRTLASQTNLTLPYPPACVAVQRTTMHVWKPPVRSRWMKRSLPLFVVPVAVGIVMAGPGSAQAAGPSLVRTEAQEPVSENWVDHAVTPSVAADTGIPGINSFDAEFVWGNRTEM